MWSAISRGFTGFMALIYIGVGVLLITAQPLFENFPPFAQPLFGALLIIYGLFRLYRLIYSIFQDRNIPEDSEDYEEEDGND